LKNKGEIANKGTFCYQIAYELGFEHAQSFRKLFKTKLFPRTFELAFTKLLKANHDHRMTVGFGKNSPSGHGHYILTGENQKNKQQIRQYRLPSLLFESTKIIFLFDL